MRKPGRAIYVAAFMLVLSHPSDAEALDCTVAAEAAACTSNADCGCGANIASGACQVGAQACVVGSQSCSNVCSGYGGIVAVCRAGACVRARATSCVGDCDADAQVDVAELVTGVAIALEHQALAACRELDRNSSGRVEVAELVSAVRAALNGCLAERDAAAEALYDAQVTFRDAGVVEALGQLNASDGQTYVDLQTSPNSDLRISGFGTDGDLTLRGSYVFTDVSVSISGSAHVSHLPDADVVTGELGSQFGYGDEPTGFVMRRSTTLTPERFAGRYRMRFFGSPSGAADFSTAMLTLEVGPHGVGMMSEAADVDSEGQPLGTIPTSDCQIAPEGHLSCSTEYLIAASGIGNLLRITGVLSLTADGGASGGGSFLAGIDPPFSLDLYVPGTWDAERVPAAGS